MKDKIQINTDVLKERVLSLHQITQEYVACKEELHHVISQMAESYQVDDVGLIEDEMDISQSITSLSHKIEDLASILEKGIRKLEDEN